MATPTVERGGSEPRQGRAIIKVRHVRANGRKRLIFAAEHRYASLWAVRALHAAGYETWVATPTRRTYAPRSRASAGVVLVPDPSTDAEGFVAALAGAARSLGVAAVLPGGEPALFALADQLDGFPPGMAVGAVSRAEIDRATDKTLLASLAAAAGLSVPPAKILHRTRLLQERNEIEFPVLLKPRRSETPVGGRRLEYVMAVRVHSFEELRAELRRRPGDEWLLQNHVPGPLGAVCGVAWKGRLICAVHQVAIRTYPSDGPSAYAITIERDVELERKVARFLELLGWSGPFQAQFIYSERDKYLIDFNPRIYGSVGLAVSAGVNIPAIWAQLLLGERPEVGDFTPGVHYRAIERDLRAVLSLLLNGNPVAAVRALAPQPQTVHAIVSLRDPLPTLTSVEKLTAIMWRNLLRRGNRGRSGAWSGL